MNDWQNKNNFLLEYLGSSVALHGLPTIFEELDNFYFCFDSRVSQLFVIQKNQNRKKGGQDV